MRTREKIISLGIVLYLFLTLCALSYTLFRRSPVPKPVVRFFYGMMAPYQGYSENNFAMIAEGQSPNGQWTKIDIDSYFPGSRGERGFRTFLLSFRTRGAETTTEGYRALAEQIRRREEALGRSWNEVRLSFESWPVSPEGFDAQRRAPFVEHIDPLGIE